MSEGGAPTARLAALHTAEGAKDVKSKMKRLTTAAGAGGVDVRTRVLCVWGDCSALSDVGSFASQLARGHAGKTCPLECPLGSCVSLARHSIFRQEENEELAAEGGGAVSTPATLREEYVVCESQEKPLVLLALLER